MTSARFSGSDYWTVGGKRLAIDISSIHGFPIIHSSRVPRCRKIDNLPRSFVVIGKNWTYEPQRCILRNHNGAIIRDSVNTSVVPKWPPISHHPSVGNRRRSDNIQTATILRTQDSNYYHTLIDNLPRLHFLNRWMECHERESVQVLVPAPLNQAERYWIPRMLPKGAMLRLIEADTDSIEIRRFLYISPYTQRFKGALPADYLSYIRELINRDGHLVESNQLVLVSRAQDAKGGRRIFNEDRLFDHLQPLGFQSYHLESMTIEDQIELFRSAKIIVAAHGSGLANLIYSTQNTTVIELFPGKYIIPHYYYLSRSLGQEYIPVFSNHFGRNDAFHVDVEAVCKAVESALFPS